MNIVLLCGEYPPCNNGGIGTFSKELAEGLSKSGNNIVVIGLYEKAYLDIDKQIEETINNVKVIRIPYKKYTGVSYIDAIINRLVYSSFVNNYIESSQIDLIESYDTNGFYILKPKIPFITRLHGTTTYFGNELKRPYSKFISYFEKSQLKNSDCIIGVSKYVLEKTIEYFGITQNKKQTEIK